MVRHTLHHFLSSCFYWFGDFALFHFDWRLFSRFSNQPFHCLYFWQNVATSNFIGWCFLVAVLFYASFGQQKKTKQANLRVLVIHAKLLFSQSEHVSSPHSYFTNDKRGLKILQHYWPQKVLLQIDGRISLFCLGSLLWKSTGWGLLELINRKPLLSIQHQMGIWYIREGEVMKEEGPINDT